MVQLLRQNYQFHAFKGEDANAHLDKYLSITQFIKQNGVSQDIINLNFFLFSLTHEAESWFYTLKTHSIHTWEEMVSKFLSKYYPYSRALQLRKDILNFQQLPTESVFEAWERFKSCLRKCPDHRILLDHQILTFYHGITMIDRDKIMVAAGGNIMQKTPQEAYDLIENMTQHHFQWDAEVYYDTTTGVSAHYSETTSALSAQIEVLGNNTGYTIQSIQHQPGPGHPNTFYYSYSDESDEDEPSEESTVQKLIHLLSGSPTPSSNSIIASLTPFGDSDFLVEETDTLLSYFDHSLPDYEAFCFDVNHQEEKSSGSTTSHSDHSLPDYEAFCFNVDHQEEKRSGSTSTTSHSDPSLLEHESFYFDLSIDPLPPAERSDSHHEEFADELAHIISPPEYDHFYFDIEVDLGELTGLLIENSSSKNVNLTEIKEDNELTPKTSTKELTIQELNDLRLLLSNCDSTFSEEFSEIDFLVSFPFGNKDKIFNPGIFIIKGVYSKRCHILPLNDFSPISFVSDLLLTDPSEIETFLSFPSGNEDKVFDPEILLIDRVLSFTRKTPHLLSDNFKIDKRHILSEISLKIVSSVSFLPKDKGIRGESI
ncbi:reverse transcriptase domain-containing protein [Tanacetum coccineum]